MGSSTLLPWAALVAFAALGANLLGTGLLILIQPSSRAVRWHAAFSFWIIAWLALQGWFALGLGGPELLRFYGWIVHMMPASFVAAALVETRGVRDRTALAVVLLAAATAGLLNPLTSRWVGIGWQAVMWGLGAILHFRDRQYDRQPGGSSLLRRGAPVQHADARLRTGATRGNGERLLKFALLVIVPIAVVGIVLLGGSFLLYVMPLLTILIQFMIFTGVIYHRFYDIEVRAARSGELAGQAAEQERLALLGELSATLAHEIRNPLTGMRSLTQRLAAPDVTEARRVRYAAVILDEVGRLDRIVENLLAVGRRPTVHSDAISATPLDPLFDDLLLLVDGRARRAGVSIERAPTDSVVSAPRDALAQALLNLLINAVSHTPEGGSVRIAAVEHDSRHVAVRVTDTGPGVPPEKREEIFEPFRTQGLGAGLGLAVVRRLARELDWQVTVADAAGGGASFEIVLPSVLASTDDVGAAVVAGADPVRA